MNRNIKIYRKLLYKISSFCKSQKHKLNNCRYYNDIMCFPRKFETDFERGWFDGYHAAMNDVLAEIEERSYWALYEWVRKDKTTRHGD